VAINIILILIIITKFLSLKIILKFAKISRSRLTAFSNALFYINYCQPFVFWALLFQPYRFCRIHVRIFIMDVTFRDKKGREEEGSLRGI
jgi:hypothetical protein